MTTKKLKILLLDIETAPHQVYVWGMWDQNVQLDRLIEHGRTLCWAAKWYGDEPTQVQIGAEKFDGRKRMIRRIHKLMNEADIVVTYNGSKFDIPMLNNEFVKLGLTPIRPNKHIDLLKTAKSQFRLASNKLNYIAEYLGVGSKVKHKGFSLWVGCLAGDGKDWEDMVDYNIGDVELLEKVYTRLRPWVKNHPDVAVENQEEHCAACGSSNIQRRGVRRTKAFSIVRVHCQDCGSWTDGSKKRIPSIKPKARGAK
jgi:DNA polymerase elongation subunit (family B)